MTATGLVIEIKRDRYAFVDFSRPDLGQAMFRACDLIGAVWGDHLIFQIVRFDVQHTGKGVRAKYVRIVDPQTIGTKT